MAINTLKGRTIFPGKVNGEILALSKPISFWGGVSPETGIIIHPEHPQYGACIANTILVLPGTIGSSSSSAIILELCRIGLAPCALIWRKSDAILSLGIVVASEMGYNTCPIVELDCCALTTGQRVSIVAKQEFATLKY